MVSRSLIRSPQNLYVSLSGTAPIAGERSTVRPTSHHRPSSTDLRYRMRKFVLASTVVATLALAGLAIAHGFDTRSVQPVSASFTAAPTGAARTSSCTGSNGHTYTTT